MKSFKHTLYILSTMIFMVACQPDPFKEIGDPFVPMESISGNWKLNKVTQTDINAEEKAFPYKSLDITDVFPYQDVTLSLNLTNGAPGTFTISNSQGLDLFDSESGTWSVNQIQAPSIIYLIDNSDSTEITIGSYPNVLNSSLVLSIIRVEDGTNKNIIRYDYEFIR